MIKVAVSATLECAHYDAAGRLHGHSYIVEAWFPAGPDLSKLSQDFGVLASKVDHTLLEDSIGSPNMEDIAAWFLREANALRIVIRRPTLGFSVEAE